MDSSEQATVADVGAAFDKRKTIIGSIVTLATLALVFLVIIPKFGSYADAWATIQTMSAASLLLLATAVVVQILVYVWPYQAAIPGLAYKPAFVTRQTSFAISNAIPAGGAVGLAMQYAMLASYSVPLSAATAGIAVTSLWSVLMTLALPVLGVLAALTTGLVEPAWIAAAALGVVITAVAALVLWLILRSEASARKVGGWAQKLVGPFTRKRANPPDMTEATLHLRADTVSVLSTRWFRVTWTNVVVVLAQFLILYAALAGVGGTGSGGVTLAAAFAAFSISRLASMIPVTPGGLGTVDAALIALLSGFGLDESVAMAATLVWRAASFIPQVSLGVATFVYWRVRQARA